MFQNDAGQVLDFTIAEEEQVLAQPLFVEGEAKPLQRGAGHSPGGGGVLVPFGQYLRDPLQEPLGAEGAVIFGEVLFEPMAHRSLLRLAGEPCPAVAAEDDVLGAVGVVPVEVGRGYVLEHVNLDPHL